MGLFDKFTGKRDGKELLRGMITHNADVIEKEGKTRADAEFLSLCLNFDHMAEMPNAWKGWQDLMAILESDYPQHFSDVVTYLGWVSDTLVLKPEAEAALRKRLGK